MQPLLMARRPCCRAASSVRASKRFRVRGSNSRAETESPLQKGFVLEELLSPLFLMVLMDLKPHVETVRKSFCPQRWV